jgi:DNA-directed RNA polymerase subunit E'/Rpb7
VYIFLKDLSIGYYEGLPTLGINSGSTVGRVPATLVRSVMIKAGRTMEVVPRKVNLSDLGAKHFNTLIELEGMQFENVGSNVKYADNTGTTPLSINHNLQNCTGGKIVLRNSGFADFAGETVPSGNGKLVAVYSYFRNAAQLFIRDVNDLNFTGDRCSGTGGGGISGNRVSIESVRSQYTGTATTLTKDFIQGIVISDITNKNINGQNVVVQDGDFGILCRFKSAINLPLGTEVKVGLAGGSLSEFNNLLQVQNLENTNVEPIATGKSITPKVLTVSQIDLAKHESTLIKIENATLIGGTKYSDSGVKVKDATGEIALFTLNAATFSGQSLPSGTLTVTAIVSEFTSGKQLTIRSADDVTGGTTGGGGGGGTDERVTAESLRAKYTGTATTITKDFIQGIVISDITNKNINGQNIVVQDGDFGIVLRFKAAINIPMGTEVKVKLAGGSLSEFNKLLQVQNLENANVEVLSSGNTVTPRTLTVSQIDVDKHESTLIKIENASIIGGNKYTDSTIKVKDATGEIALFTLSASTFGASALPTGTVTVTAIVSEFTTGKQLNIRSLDDVK